MKETEMEGRAPLTGENAERKYCLNCGTECDSNFCPECGQAQGCRRLTMSYFVYNAISGIFKVNKGVIYTAGHLLIHPWKVIRDYIHGKRARYTEPILMLVILCFINSLVTWTIQSYGNPTGGQSEDVLSSIEAPGLIKFLVTLFVTMIQNEIFLNFICFIPAVLLIPLVYRKARTGRFNLAEYLVAMVYISCANLEFDLIMLPLSPFVNIQLMLSMLYMISVGAVGLYKAFPFATKASSIRHFIYFCLLVMVGYLAILSVLVLVGNGVLSGLMRAIG